MGTMLATARSDGYCHVWDFYSLSLIRKLSFNSSSLNSICWSESSEFLVAGNDEGQVILFDLRTDLVSCIHEFSSKINHTGFAPNSK
ncbi:Guanine nucleotide-binding protein subunit beta [Smittium culicis]|uniref:Guanine nucleotide-binding protein subunit beta n=1 Tax=Smittium culicis TaxID=133412 RepID=A0A1R1YM11_9FUNG|nr:Guanine nucleotide-binding protein subunit beta [Smittium culicis]